MITNEIPQLDPKQQELLQRKIAQMEGIEQDLDETPIPAQSIYRDERRVAAPIEPARPVYENPVKNNGADDLKRRIAEAEELIGITPRTASTSEITFRDSSGDETLYVRNICGMHIVLSDLEIEKIPVGKSVDLLRYASLADLKKSRDLRKCLYGTGKEKTLKRLTEQEYYEDIQREALNKKKLDALQNQEQLRTQNAQQEANAYPHDRTTFAKQNQTVRGVIEAKLGKLMLRADKDPENSKFAMQSPEFIGWIQNEPLTHAEIEYIMGHPAVIRDYDIRAALLEKKGQVPPE